MTDVLFIQGAGAGVHDGWDRPLVENLRRELGPGYEVRYPAMPNAANPTIATWRPVIEQELASLQSGGIVIGHSAGAILMLHVLADSSATIFLGAIVLIAAPFIGAGGWAIDGMESSAAVAKRLPSSVPILLYHGDDDATVPVAHVELYAAAIPRARVRRMHGHDHQLNNDLSELARDIREL